MAVAVERVALSQVEERAYQTAIADACKGRSSLIVLPTGLGKTLICARVMLHHLEAGQRVLVLAPTRPLVEQHATTFRTHLPAFEVEVLTGAESPERRRDAWTRARVVVATPQVARNDLLSNALPDDAWGLLVVDEAHRCVGNYAAVDVALRLRARGTLVLGATASPASNVERLRQCVEALGVEHVEARGEWDEDVRPYVQPVAQSWVQVGLPRSLEEAAASLRRLAQRDVDELRSMGLYASRFLSRGELLRIRRELEKRLGGATDARTSRAFGGVARALRVLHGVHLIETQSVKAGSAYLTKLLDDPQLGGELALREALDRLAGLHGEHPKMRRCAMELEQHIREHPGARVLVFVQFRDTAATLAEALRALHGLRPGLFVGQSGTDGLTQREQVELLDGFRRGDVNVLVATSVGEEGLDVPEVDLVLFYEPVASAIRSIQRRGRTGRMREGRVVVLVARGTSDEAAYWAAQKKERAMRGLVRELGNFRAAKPPASSPPEADLEPGPEPGVRVLVDHRELNGPLPRLIAQKGVHTEPTNLSIGDVVVSNRIVVERKRARDFVASILDGRLMEQARLLKRNFEAPLFIIEGDPFAEAGGLRPEAIAGALAALAGGFGITVLPVADVQQAASIVVALARREQEDGRGPPALRHGTAGRTVEEQQRFLVEGLPHVSGTLAQRLLHHFGAPGAIFAASADDLRRVRGIGPVTAKAIHDVLHTTFDQPWPSATSTRSRALDPGTPCGPGAARSGS